MSSEFLTILTLLVFSAGYALLAFRMLFRKREVGSLPLGFVFLVIAFWVAGGAIEFFTDNLFLYRLARTLHFAGSALSPVLLFLCFMEFTGRLTPLRTTCLLMVAPIATIALAMTNHMHEMMWRNPTGELQLTSTSLPIDFGLWFQYLHAPYSYAMLLFGLIALVVHIIGVSPRERRSLIFMVVASLVPVFAIALYDAGIVMTEVPFLPAVFVAMLPVYAWLMLIERVTEFTPVAYETVFQAMQDPVILIDDEERIIGLNRGAESLIDVNKRDALLEPLSSAMETGSRSIRNVLRSGEPQKMLTKSGRFLHVQVSSISTNNAASRQARVVMFRDVSDVEQAQRDVATNEKLLRTLIDHSANGILRLRWVSSAESEEQELRCIFSNAAAGRYLGINPDEMIDRTANELLSLATCGMDAEDARQIAKDFAEASEDGRGIDTETIVNIDGESTWLRLICKPVGDDVAMTFMDVTGGKLREKQMESMARSDPLTGVLNRRGFERDAAQRLTSSSDDACGALMFIDLNDFKQINDQYGHEIGDQLLIIAAERLQTSLRSCDIIGRPGGDEFVALIPDVSDEKAEMLAERLTEAMGQAYKIDDLKLNCSASIGLAHYPRHANTLTGLLRAADEAMYRAKARRRARVSDEAVSLFERAG